MSSSYEVEFLGREACGADVVSMQLSRPPGFDFIAGQWLVLTLPSSGRPLAETFTICSAPSDDYLEITTRLTGSAYKNALARLASGDRARVAGPGGRLALPRDATRLAFLVGGVGITPVHSMLREAVATKRVFDDAVLFYANRDASCVPFGTEFAAMARLGVRTVLCYEHPPEGWTGESGLITAGTVRRHLSPGEVYRPIIVAGPPTMVEAMERVLDELGVPVEHRLVEHFGHRASTNRQPEVEPPAG